MIRPLAPTDAEALHELRLRLDEETQFMLLEPGERKITVDQTRQQLAAFNGMIWGAVVDDILVGYLQADRGRFQRIRHSAYIVVGIRQGFTGQGIGTQLFNHLEQWASQNAIHRLELSVMTHNKAGLALYQKMGFEIEGTKRHSLVINGDYVDEYYMAKLLMPIG